MVYLSSEGYLVDFLTCLVLVDVLAAGVLAFLAVDFLGDLAAGLAAGLADFLGVAFLLFFFFFGASS